MKLILSPTKTMAGRPEGSWESGRPGFEHEAGLLIRELKHLDPKGLKKLFKTSDALTGKVYDMVQGFGDARSCPALFAFYGEAFKTLGAKDFSPKELKFAQAHLRIFSGLYGVVSPLDEIRPYRLDFNTPLKINGSSLKVFWKKRLIPYFEALMAADEPLINLASDEFTSILSPTKIKDKMITLQFREQSGGTLKNITVRTKQARGSFAGHIIRKALTDPEPLKQTVIDGYTYSNDLSSDHHWFFIR